MIIEEKYLDAIIEITNYVEDDLKGEWMSEAIRQGIDVDYLENWDWNTPHSEYQKQILEYGKDMGLYYYLILLEMLYPKLVKINKGGSGNG